MDGLDNVIEHGLRSIGATINESIRTEIKNVLQEEPTLSNEAVASKVLERIYTEEQMSDDSLAADREDMMKLILGKVERTRRNS